MENLPLEMTLRVDSSPQTDQGKKRPNNEDWVAGFEPNDPAEIERSGYLYIVADGVGGASKGERASQYAAQKVLYEYYQHPELPTAERLSKIIRQAGNEIYQYSIENATSRMATTLVAAVIRGDRLTVANVGDSRAYLIRGASVTQITRDHNLANELIRNGTMTVNEAKRSKTRNKLMRSLGGELNVDVDVFKEIQLIPGDLIILCTDGLTRYATDEDLIRLSCEGSPEEIGKELVAFANQSGGADNITMYIIEVKTDDAENPKSFSGHAPKPVDWDTIQTQSETPKLKARKRERFTKQQIYILLILFGLVAILIVAGSLFLATLGGDTTTPLTEAAPTQTQQIASIQTKGIPSLEATNETIPTENVVVNENIPTTTLELAQTDERKCVHEIQSGENTTTIYELYNFNYTLGEPVYQFIECDKSVNLCTGPVQKVDDPGEIDGGNFLQIPGVVKEICEGTQNSYWVTVTIP